VDVVNYLKDKVQQESWSKTIRSYPTLQLNKILAWRDSIIHCCKVSKV